MLPLSYLLDMNGKKPHQFRLVASWFLVGLLGTLGLIPTGIF